MSLKVLKAGLQSTIQDLGRFSVAHLGISASGTADSFSLRIGNLLVGNPENTAAIEMTLTGDTYQFHSDTYFALTGSPFKVELDGNPVLFWKRNFVRKNQVLKIGPTTAGARCYFCVRGGFAVENIFNSASTHLTSGIGGLGGKPLQKGDEIEIGDINKTTEPMPVLGTPPQIDTSIIRVTKSLQWDWFDHGSRKVFFEQQYRMADSSNRMGLRLEGQPILSAKGNEIITEGIPLGAIQIPGNGQPIISFVEHQTTGGYPKLTNVINADLYKAGQLKPGDHFQFRLVDFQKADQALQDIENYIQSLKTPKSQKR